MINQNFEDYPEHRLNFYKLIQAINTHCFPAIFAIPPEHQKLVVDAIIWAFRHTDRTISELGLDILQLFLKNVSTNQAIAQSFYQSFYLTLLQDLMYVLTDRLHKSAFKHHATLLQYMFRMVESDEVKVPLWDAAKYPAMDSNQRFIRQFVVDLISSSFQNMSRAQCEEFVGRFFDLNSTLGPSHEHLKLFKSALRDFLISVSHAADVARVAGEMGQRSCACVRVCVRACVRACDVM